MAKSAIVLSGHTMALGVVRALGREGIPVVVMHYDRRDMAHVSRYVSEHMLIPHPEKEEALFVAFLRSAAQLLGGGVLIPASDESLAAVSRHKALLAEDYVVACPEWEIAKRFIDKKETYALAEQHGVPAPRTLVPRSEQEVVRYATDIEFPCLVKPCQSHLFYDRFKRKMIRVEDLDQMLAAYRAAAEAGLEVMLQEIIPGGDCEVVNYNAYVWGGRSLVEFTTEHVRNAPPFFGSPRVVLSKKIPEVIEPGRKILQAMQFYGYACTEFKRDPRDGVFKLMEVNGRHNLSTLLAPRCGINFPWLEYRHLVHGEIPAAADFETGIYWVDTTRDLGYSISHFRQEMYTPAQYLRPYFKPHVFAIADRNDFEPFAKRVAFLAREALDLVRPRARHHLKGTT